MLVVSVILSSTEKSSTNPFNAAFFMLSAVKSFEIFLKHNGYGFISEFFALDWYTFMALTKKLLLPL